MKITRVIIKETTDKGSFTIDCSLYNISALEVYSKLLELEKIGEKA